MRSRSVKVVTACLVMVLCVAFGVMKRTAHAEGELPRLPVKPGPVPPLPATGDPQATPVRVASPAAASPAPKKQVAALEPAQVALPPEVNGGVIDRARLEQVLARGPGRFLQAVRVEPHLRKGRFHGWRLRSIFAGRSDESSSVLAPGDTVMRANGQSLERPEEFKAVWDSLSGARELVLDIERGGKPSKVRYTIAD